MAYNKRTLQNTTSTVADNDVTVIGSTGGNEVIIINSGVTGTVVDGNLEAVNLSGSLESYTFQNDAVKGLLVLNAGNVVASFASINNTLGTLIKFTDGSVSLKQNADTGAFTLGSKTVSTTAGAITTADLGSTFDTAVKSSLADSNGNGGSTNNNGSAYTLKTSADFLVGTAGDDTFSGSAGSIDGDNLSGGAGNDKLNLTVTVADDDQAAFTSTGVETISIRSTGGVAGDGAFIDLELGNVSGAQTIELSRLNDDVALVNLTSLTTNLKVTSVATASDITVNYDASIVTGTADTTNVTITNSTGGGDLVVNAVETLALTAIGTANDLNVDGSTLKTVTVAGTGKLNVDVDASVTTFDATSNEGGVTVNFTVAANVSVTGGTGNDTFAFDNTLTSSDTVAGGLGTDTLSVSNIPASGGAIIAIPDSAKVTGVEALTINSFDDNGADAITLDGSIVKFATVNIVASDAADTYTFTKITTESINVTDVADGDDAVALIDVSLTDATGSSDALTLNITNADLDTAFTVTDINSTGGGIETLNLVLNQGKNVASASDIIIADISSTHSTLNISGAADATLGGTPITVEKIDASTATGALAFTFGTADQSVVGGLGNDTFAFASELTTLDTVVGGEGTDKLTATPAAGTARPTVSGVEKIQLDFGTASASVNLGSVTGATTLNLSGDEAHTVSSIPASIATVNLASTDAGGGETVTLTYNSAVTSPVTVTIGDVVDGTAGSAVVLDAVNIATFAGALTLASNGDTGNSINGFDANTATSLTISTVKNLAIAGAGDDDISATKATTVTVTTAGGALAVGDGLIVTAAATIALSAANGSLTITGDVFSDANAPSSVLNEVTDVTLSAKDNYTLLIDGVLDVEFAQNVSLSATNAGDVRVDGVDFAGTDGDGDNLALNITLTTDAKNSTINFNTGSGSGTSVIDLITVVSGKGSTTGVTETTITNADTDVTITSIDATAAAGDLVVNLTTSDDAASITTGSGNATITGSLAADTIVLGSGVNFVSNQDGADTITAGSGVDTIVPTTQDDTIVVNQFNASGDLIGIDLSDWTSGLENGNDDTVSVALLPIAQTETGGGVVTLSATTNILKLTATYATSAAVETALETNLRTGTNIDDGDDVIVVWTDGADTFIGNLDLTTNDTAVTITTAIRLVGVSIADISAADFFFQA
jgi:hypothetical protein